MACGIHETLSVLLSSNDQVLVQCSLAALSLLSRTERLRWLIGEHNITDVLLLILQEHQVASKRMAAELLRALATDEQTRQAILGNDGLATLLRC